MDDVPLRRAIVEAGARLGRRGLIAAAEGNLSVQLSDGRLLVTPTGRRKDELTPDDLVVVDEQRPAAVEPRSPNGSAPTSDLAVHRAIYAARPNVTAVVHAHLPASMALTLAGERPDPQVLPETALFLPVLPVVAFAEMGSHELAKRVAAALGEGNPAAGAAILERHGAVAVGSGDAGAPALTQAVDRLELVEVLCRVWRDALLVRAARAAVERR